MMTIIDRYVWFHELSDQQKVVEIKKDNTLCRFVWMSPEHSLTSESTALCEDVLDFEKL